MYGVIAACTAYGKGILPLYADLACAKHNLRMKSGLCAIVINLVSGCVPVVKHFNDVYCTAMYGYTQV